MRISDWSSDVCSSDLAQSEGIKLEIDCPDKLPGFRGDAKRLRQGLFRLIAEAIYCARPGATLRFTARETNMGLNLSITEELPSGERSEERRVGKECGSKWRSRLSPEHKKKKKK